MTYNVERAINPNHLSPYPSQLHIFNPFCSVPLGQTSLAIDVLVIHHFNCCNDLTCPSGWRHYSSFMRRYFTGMGGLCFQDGNTAYQLKTAGMQGGVTNNWLCCWKCGPNPLLPPTSEKEKQYPHPLLKAAHWERMTWKVLLRGWLERFCPLCNSCLYISSW